VRSTSGAGAVHPLAQRPPGEPLAEADVSDVPLLLIDGHNLLFRACFGTPAQSWSRDPHDKRDLTTEFMFFALLRMAVNEELPGWPEVVVVFDGQDGSARRKAAVVCYKANWPEGGEALKPIRALPSVKAGLDLFAIAWVEIDDVIATLAASCPERDVLIASADQDFSPPGVHRSRNPGPSCGLPISFIGSASANAVLRGCRE
jgi:5'-3' exonuclease